MDHYFFEFMVSGGSSLSSRAFRIYCILRAEISSPATSLTRALRKRGVLASTLPLDDIARRADISSVAEVDGIIRNELARAGWLSIEQVEESEELPVWRLGSKTESGWVFMEPRPSVDLSEGCESIDARVAWSERHRERSPVATGGLLDGSGTAKVKRVRKRPLAPTTRLLTDFGALYLETFGYSEPACVPAEGSRFPRKSYGMISHVLNWVDGDILLVSHVMEWLFENWQKILDKKCLHKHSPTLTFAFFCSRFGFHFGLKWRNSPTFPPAASVSDDRVGSFDRADEARAEEEAGGSIFHN